MAGTRLIIDQAELDRQNAFMAEQAARDPSGLMPRLGEYLQGSTQARFKTQTAPDGTPWAPLKQRYARRKRYNKDTVLTLRGYLRSYIHYQVMGADAVEVGSNQKYAAIHQFGGMAGRGKKVEIPARPFLPITADGKLQPEASEEVLDTVMRHLRTAVLR